MRKGLLPQRSTPCAQHFKHHGRPDLLRLVLFSGDGNLPRSVCDPLPNPLPEAVVPQDRDVAAMHLGANALGHDESADRISSRAGADHPGGSGHGRVVVLVAQPLSTWPGRRRLRSASFTPHARPPSRARNRGGEGCPSRHPHHDTVVSQKRAGRETHYLAAEGAPTVQETAPMLPVPRSILKRQSCRLGCLRRVDAQRTGHGQRPFERCAGVADDSD